MKLKTRPSTGTIAVVIKTPHGERSISTGCKDMATAREVVKLANIKAVEAAAKAGVLTQSLIHKLTVGGTLHVWQCVEEWKKWLKSTAGSDRTAENTVMYVRMWMREMKLANQRITSIKEHHISDWVNAPDGTKMGTRRVRLAAIRSLFLFCGIREYIGADPSRLVRIKARNLTHEQKEPQAKTCFSDDEYERVIKHLRERIALKEKGKGGDKLNLRTLRFWLAATIIGRFTGLRLGDIASLEWASIGNGNLVVWTDKRDRRVSIPISKELGEGLALIPKNNRRLCFPEQDSLMRHPTKRSKLSVQFGRILAAAGVEGHSFHDLRHTLATELDANGESIEAIAEALGHGSKESTETYIHRSSASSIS